MEHFTAELWAMKLGLRLLQERAKKGSFWWPYISNLPETYTVPIFFPGEDIMNLQYAPLLQQVNVPLWQFSIVMLKDTEIHTCPFYTFLFDTNIMNFGLFFQQ